MCPASRVKDENMFADMLLLRWYISILLLYFGYKMKSETENIIKQFFYSQMIWNVLLIIQTHYNSVMRYTKGAGWLGEEREREGGGGVHMERKGCIGR